DGTDPLRAVADGPTQAPRHGACAASMGRAIGVSRLPWGRPVEHRATRARVAGAAAAAVADVETAQAVPPDPTAAAFFDVDNTMMMGASIFHFAKGLASREYFTVRDLASFGWQQGKFRLGGQELPEDIH